MAISPAARRVLDGLAETADDLVERAISWACVNSGSGNPAGLATMCEILATELGRLPGEVRRVKLAPVAEIGADGKETLPPGADALLLTVRPHAPFQVALTGHYDTVYPPDSEFQTVRTRGDGALHGPGIADMKGGISVMLGALAAFERHDASASLGYQVLLSPDEETGSLGSAPLLASLAQRARIGMTYEPAGADGSFAAARKGSGNFHLVVRGRSAHAGRDFASGRNAVLAAARLAERLAALSHDAVTINIARIDGGGPLNMVPDLAVLRFNIRYDDPADGERLKAAITTAIADAGRGGFDVTLHGGFHRPAKPFTPAQRALFAALKETGAMLGQAVTWAPSGGVCEGNNLFAAGLPNIDTLGVRGGDIHSEREFAWPESFLERAQLSTLLLARFAEGEISV